jgi:hypothetical protein
MIAKKITNVRIAKTDLILAAVNEGRKLCVKAPSPKIRRRRLGNLKATKKISL